MNVIITGGGGFIGQRLAKRILDLGVLTDSKGIERAVTKLTLSDIALPTAPFLEDSRLELVVGDFGLAKIRERLVTRETGVIFHLAAVVSGGAEEDFELGMRVNLHATIDLFEHIRLLGTCPRLVFASSVATYGGELPEVIRDDTPLMPQTSYGCQKAMTELLINDYSRRGFFDGRALRLPTIVVRPGKPNKAASSFASAIVREPLQGMHYTCPVPRETGVWVLSPRQVVESFLHAERLPAEAWGQARALALPGLTTTVGEMIDAMETMTGRSADRYLHWENDPEIQRIVRSWPVRFQATRALELGFAADLSIREIINGFVSDELDGRFAR